MVEVFKTSVQEIKESEKVLEKLCAQFPGHTINFDLEDCDNILRVENTIIDCEKIITIMTSLGHQCDVLN